MKKSTYRRLRKTVSTVKKSVASKLCAWARTKSRQDSEYLPPVGSSPAFCNTRRTVVAETAMPTPDSSPWIRR